MSDIGFGVSSSGSLEIALTAISDDLGSFVRSGFNILAELDQAHLPKVIDAVRTMKPYPSSIEIEPLADILDIDVARVAALVTAARLLLSIVAFREDSIDEILRAATAVKILDTGDAEKVRSFVQSAASNRQALRRELRSTTLEHSVLPSLTLFETAVDLRLEFKPKSNEVAIAAPVAIVHIDTDTSEKELWFQMSVVQMESLHGQLTTLLSRLKVAEGMAKKLP